MKQPRCLTIFSFLKPQTIPNIRFCSKCGRGLGTNEYICRCHFT